MNPNTAPLSIVIIGKNEGVRLTKCLESVFQNKALQRVKEIIYVDSNSTDDSIERAKKFKIKIISVDPPKPSPSMPRNMGWKAASGKFILFLDGDTQLENNFINNAIDVFENPSIGIVCGKTIELYPEANIYHRAFAFDWNPQIGLSDHCGGNFMVRRQVLESLAGFDETLIAGEEPELVLRMKNLGLSLMKLNIPMVYHDLNMNSFKEYWNRSVRTGYAYADVSSRYWNSPNPLWRRESIHNVIKVGVFLIILLVSCLFIILTCSIKPLLVFLCIMTILILRTAYKAKNDSHNYLSLFIYAIHSHFQHLPIFLGQLKYWIKMRKFPSLSKYR